MNTSNKFRNLSGLTQYALACGYVQRIESDITGENISLELWMENGCYHVRAHNYDSIGRIEWVSENSISDARTQYKRLYKEIWGSVISTNKDRRYTVTRELSGDQYKQFVVRFCDQWIGKSDDKLAAAVIIAEHKKNPKKHL